MKRAVFQYIEAELFDYRQTRQALEELKLDIIEEGPRPDLLFISSAPPTNKITNPTLYKTVQLLTNKRINKMAETITAIERVYRRAPEEKQKLIQLKYWDGRYSNHGVAEKLNVSLATYYRWRRDIVLAVAIEMGLINTAEAS